MSGDGSNSPSPIRGIEKKVGFAKQRSLKESAKIKPFSLKAEAQ